MSTPPEHRRVHFITGANGGSDAETGPLNASDDDKQPTMPALSRQELRTGRMGHVNVDSFRLRTTRGGRRCSLVQEATETGRRASIGKDNTAGGMRLNVGSGHESTSSYSGSESESYDEADPTAVAGGGRASVRDHVIANAAGSKDFRVRSLKPAAVATGRLEITMAREEMAGISSLVSAQREKQPLKGARVVGCTHITAQTGVMIEALVELGAQVRWCACNIYSSQNAVAAALVESGIPVYAWRGETEDDFWWCINECINAESWQPNLVLDDGGDTTHWMHKHFAGTFNALRGIVEDSVTGVHRLYSLAKEGNLPAPAINTSDAVVRSNLKRTTDVMIAGKSVTVCGYGEVGKGVAGALKGLGAVVAVTEIDPICALQACMDGYAVKGLSVDTMKQTDILISCTGNKNVITRLHFDSLRHNAIVCNMGHSNVEIDVESIRTPELKWQRVRSQCDHIQWPDGRRIILLAEGRMLNLTCASVPALVASIGCVTQILALIELHTAPDGRYSPQEVYLLPKKLDERVAALHLCAFNAELTRLSEDQAHYMGLSKHGPFKPPYYKY